jgi:MFS transporter, Spinster family, sphingosine-1-phosphate transporter
VGVGEAAYATISPSLISDFYPKERRNRILTIFYVAIPVGAALGFTLGGLVGHAAGWRMAFLVCGPPGVLAAALAFWIKDPGRGTFDTEKPEPVPGWGDAVKALARNRPYVVAVAGYTAVTFAAGGMADWFPTFLSRHRGMDIAEAGSLVGTITVIGGLAGTAAGGLLADRLARHTRQPYLAVSAVSMVLAAGFAAATLAAQSKALVIACMLAAQFFLWFYNGPINTIIANSVASNLVARAFGISILCIHLFGDAVSPPIIGAISDRTGSLPMGVSVVPVTLAIGAAIWFWGWRRLPEPTR